MNQTQTKPIDKIWISALRLSVESLPDIVGTLAPTITVSLINAIPAFRIAKNPSTHKDANKSI